MKEFNPAIARGAFYYDIKKDSWVWTLEIPCNDHDGKTFKDSNEEQQYYLAKAKALLNAFK